MRDGSLVDGIGRGPAAHPAARGIAFAIALALAGCSSLPAIPLMPTPVLFTDVGLDPLADVPPGEQWTPRRVYYATVRERVPSVRRIDYTNRPGEHISFGLALIGFGGSDTTWGELREASTRVERDELVELSIAGLVEGGRAGRGASGAEAASPAQAGWIFEDLNDAIEDARDKDVLVYVHGAKVDFYNSCAYAAQLDHFLGRDMTAVAFSWPTRQNLLAYALGPDRRRAYASGAPLATLLEILAHHTDARRIHVLSWSAGARVATTALRELAERYAEADPADLREQLRIGTVYFAAGDIPRTEFLETLPTVHDLAERVVVSTSSGDEALVAARRLMRGGQRIGQSGGRLDEDARVLVAGLERLEVVDVSAGREERGFDITGHRYWFSHPWASSDVLLAVRSDLPAAERGLVEVGDLPILWAMPADYPERLAEALGDLRLPRR